MQELEKILEEINEEIKSSIAFSSVFTDGLCRARNILRKHLSRENGQEIMGIKIRDNETGEIFEYGTNIHHALRISKNGGCLTFENLQNGDGSSKSGDGGYSFVLNDGKTPEESSSPDSMYGATYANIGGFHEHLSRENAPEITRLSRDNGVTEYCTHCDREITVSWNVERDGLDKILEEIEAEHPYKVPGNYDSYSQYNEAWQDAIDRVRARLEEFFQEKDNDGWIPVEERLPEEEVSVLAQWEKYDKYLNVKLIYLDVMWLDDAEKKVFETINGVPNGKVTAWRPLPEPYRPERSNDEKE